MKKRKKTTINYENKCKELKIGHHKAIVWFLTCVNDSTSRKISRFSHSYEAWEHLKQTHTIKDITYMYNLQINITNLHQGKRSIIVFVVEIDQ